MKELIQISCAIITVILGLYLAFYKSYFQEKGKSLVTIKDISKITTLVEEAKKQFTHEIEFLRNSLNIYSSNLNSIKVLERNALIEINTKYSEWLNALVTFSLIYYSYNDYEILKSKEIFFSEKEMAFNIAQDNLHLYVHDEELMKKKGQLITLTYELHKSVLKNITKFTFNCTEYNYKRETAKIEDLLRLNIEYHAIQKPLIESSLDERDNIFLKLHNYQIEFIKILNYKIYDSLQLN